MINESIVAVLGVIRVALSTAAIFNLSDQLANFIRGWRSRATRK